MPRSKRKIGQVAGITTAILALALVAFALLVPGRQFYQTTRQVNQASCAALHSAIHNLGLAKPYRTKPNGLLDSYGCEVDAAHSTTLVVTAQSGATAVSAYQTDVENDVCPRGTDPTVYICPVWLHHLPHEYRGDAYTISEMLPDVPMATKYAQFASTVVRLHGRLMYVAFDITTDEARAAAQKTVVKTLTQIVRSLGSN